MTEFKVAGEHGHYKAAILFQNPKTENFGIGF
jgi:hypothetical protein